MRAIAKRPIPAHFKGLDTIDEVIDVSQRRERDLKEKAGMQLSSLVEVHKRDKTIVAGSAVGFGVALDTLAHTVDFAGKYDPLISGALGVAGLMAGAADVEEEWVGSVGMGLAAAGFTRMAAAGVRMGIDKLRDAA